MEMSEFPKHKSISEASMLSTSRNTYNGLASLVSPFPPSPQHPSDTFAGIVAILVAISGYYLAMTLYKARNRSPEIQTDLDSAQTMRRRRRFIPCVSGFLPNAGWAFVAYHVAIYNNYELGPALYTSFAGLITALLWAVVRLVRRWGCKASAAENTKAEDNV